MSGSGINAEGVHPVPFRLLPVLLLYLLLLPQRGMTQTLLQGKVVDAQTGTPLETAHVAIQGTFRGTITNAEGWFELRVAAFPLYLEIQHIGYRSAHVAVSVPPASPLEIRLEPVTYTLPEVVVGGEDHAVEIMRRVIEAKQVWQKQLQTYRAEAYSRQVVENDTGIVFITESYSDVYWKQREGPREVLRARWQTANVREARNRVGARYLPNFYDDDIAFAGFQFIGPTHPEALSYYRFRLIGYRYLDDRLVYDIEVKPATRFQPVFEGRLAVLDEVYALLEVDLHPASTVHFPPPFEEVDVTFRQQFSAFGQQFWLPVDVRYRGRFKVGFPGLELPLLRVRQLTQFFAYEVNIPIPDSLFKREKHVWEHIDSTLTLERIPRIPLARPEVAAYQTIDSTLVLEKVFAPRGPLAALARLSPGETSSRPYMLMPRLWYNRVQGAFTGLAGSLRLHPSVQVSAEAGYGWAARQWDLAASLRLQSGNFYVEPRMTRVTALRFPSVYGRMMGGIGMLFGGQDYLDYYRREAVGVEIGRVEEPAEAFVGTRSGGWLSHMGYGFRLRYAREYHTSLPVVTEWTLWGRQSQRSNPPVLEGLWHHFYAFLRLGDPPLPSGFLGRHGVDVEIDHARHAEAIYTRMVLQADWRWYTFLRRRFLPMTLDVRLRLLQAWGKVPPQGRWVLDGTPGGVGSFGTFRTLTQAFLEGRRGGALYWEHNFRTMPFELLGLRFLVRHGVELGVTGSHGFMEPGRQRYHEVGFYVNRILDLLSLEIVFRLDRPGFALVINAARFF